MNLGSHGQRSDHHALAHEPKPLAPEWGPNNTNPGNQKRYQKLAAISIVWNLSSSVMNFKCEDLNINGSKLTGIEIGDLNGFYCFKQHFFQIM